MLRTARLPAARVLLMASAALALVTIAARPAAAAPGPGDTPGSKTDLVGAASTFGDQTTTIFLTNAGPGPLRAIVTVHDGDDVLLGCGVRMFRKGESDFLYFKSWQSGRDGPLVVNVYGVQATGSLMGSLTAQPGLRGVISQVHETTGETIAELEMLPVSSTALERQTQIDDCFTTGFAGNATPGSTNALTATEPGRWDEKPQAAPSTSSVTVVSPVKKPNR